MLVEDPGVVQVGYSWAPGDVEGWEGFAFLVVDPTLDVNDGDDLPYHVWKRREQSQSW